MYAGRQASSAGFLLPSGLDQYYLGCRVALLLLAAEAAKLHDKLAAVVVQRAPAQSEDGPMQRLDRSRGCFCLAFLSGEEEEEEEDEEEETYTSSQKQSPSMTWAPHFSKQESSQASVKSGQQSEKEVHLRHKPANRRAELRSDRAQAPLDSSKRPLPLCSPCSSEFLRLRNSQQVAEAPIDRVDRSTVENALCLHAAAGGEEQEALEQQQQQVLEGRRRHSAVVLLCWRRGRLVGHGAPAVCGVSIKKKKGKENRRSAGRSHLCSRAHGLTRPPANRAILNGAIKPQAQAQAQHHQHHRDRHRHNSHRGKKSQQKGKQREQ